MPHARPAKAWNPGRIAWLSSPPVREIGTLIDTPPVSGPGVEGGTATQEPGPSFARVLDLVIGTALPRPVVPAQAPASVAKPAAVPVQQIRVSGPVQAARLIHRVEPVYPAFARQIRLAGTVELAGIVGVDGRIRELKVTRGHPLLIPAALDAVRLWIYEPTSLNGRPVEVVTNITVVFRLI